MWRFAWKEYRMLRGFWLAGLVIALSIQVLAYVDVLRVGALAPGWYMMVAWSAAALYSVGAAITVFCAETEERTRDYLRLLPGDWRAIFSSKVADGVGDGTRARRRCCHLQVAGWQARCRHSNMSSWSWALPVWRCWSSLPGDSCSRCGGSIPCWPLWRRLLPHRSVRSGRLLRRRIPANSWTTRGLRGRRAGATGSVPDRVCGGRVAGKTVAVPGAE